MMRALFSVLALALAVAIVSARAEATDAAAPASARGMPDQQVSTMKIRMDLEGTALTATLVDNPTSRDFVALLPLTLTLTDYAGTEKSVICHEGCRQKARLPAAIRQLAISLIRRLGAIWPSFIVISAIRGDSSS